MIERACAIGALENTLDTFELNDLETIKALIDKKIDEKKREKCEKEYDRLVSDIINSIEKIIELDKGWQVAFTIEEDEYYGLEEDIRIDWNDLLAYL